MGSPSMVPAMGFLNRIFSKEHGHEHLVCNACGGQFHTKEEMAAHAAKEHPAPALQCAACGGATFPSKEALAAHRKSAHGA